MYAITPAQLDAFIAEIQHEQRVVAQLLDEDTSLSRAEVHDYSDRLETLRQVYSQIAWTRRPLEKLVENKGEAERRLDALYGYGEGSVCDGFAMASKLQAAAE